VKKCTSCESGAFAGVRNRRVTLQERAAGVDSDGKPNGAWTAVSKPWVMIEPLRGKELIDAQQAKMKTTHKVTMLYRAGVVGKQRLLYGTRVLNIDGVINPNESNEILELMCVEES